MTCVAGLRATKLAPLLTSVRMGLIGWSRDPVGSVFDLKPRGDVGDVCRLGHVVDQGGHPVVVEVGAVLAALRWSPSHR